MTRRRQPDRDLSRRAGPLVPGLRELAFVADGERGVVLGPHGDVLWMCAPAWHSDAVFSRLVGGAGEYVVRPSVPYTVGGAYREGTLVWDSTWATHDGVLHGSAALAVPADPRRAVLLRRFTARGGPVPLMVTLNARDGFGARGMREVDGADGVWTARTGSLRVRWTGAPEAALDGGSLRLDTTLRPGQDLDLVLELCEGRLPDRPRAEDLWTGTEQWWDRSPDPDGTAASRDARLAAAVLRGLTASSGAMVAAATMCLPERAVQGRSYDYRYAWVRDQCYAGVAAAAAGLDDLLDAAVRFVSERVLSDGPALRPVYRVDGGPVPAERSLRLPGYPGGHDVVGNRAGGQSQLDVLGEVLQLLGVAGARGRLDSAGWDAVRVAADAVAESWQRPDAGIWELAPDWWTQSRLACVAGLRQVAQLAVPPSAAAARASAPRTSADARLAGLADAILAETSARCLHPDGFWQRSPTVPGTDASLLRPPVRGALPADDPRTRATLEAVLAELEEDGYVYRFAAPDHPLGTVEGAFLLCGFLTSQALAQQGRHVEAARWFERTRSACGSPGLFTEEYDVRQRQLRGNLPQAFVHAALLETATALTRA